MPGASSAIALEAAARPSLPRQVGGAIGQAGSRDSLAQLDAAMVELRMVAVLPLLRSAINAVNGNDFQAASEWAIKVLEKDEKNGYGWYLLAMSRERLGDFASSVKAYEMALELLPNQGEVANDLGRLAYRMGMVQQAEKLFRHFLVAMPNHHEGVNNLACILRDQTRFDEAINILKPVLLTHAEMPILWNTMGTIVTEQGDTAMGRVFFEEALRLDQDFAKARYNLGNVLLVQGDPEAALVECERAMSQKVPDDELQMMRLARALILLAVGRIGEGWDGYEARRDPNFIEVLHFAIDRPQWAPGEDLAGKSMLIFGEQGLGDEVLFANVLPDVVEALGPEGKLAIAVEKRLVPLFQRSFPQATVGPHASFNVQGKGVRMAPFIEDESVLDTWAPLGGLLREFRRDLASFPKRERFLTPDPKRVAHWREELAKATAGKKVGLLWKSMIKDGARHRYFSSFEQWAGVLATQGVTFVNMQYGDCGPEIEKAKREFGVEIWQPPGIDLKQDLDDVAALSCALDLMIGFSNANFNLAGACGAPAWMLTTPGAWPRLGADAYPWYPQVRVFAAPIVGDWDPVMVEVGKALTAFAKS